MDLVGDFFITLVPETLFSMAGAGAVVGTLEGNHLLYTRLSAQAGVPGHRRDTLSTGGSLTLERLGLIWLYCASY